jgi:hypothetical protein
MADNVLKGKIEWEARQAKQRTMFEQFIQRGEQQPPTTKKRVLSEIIQPPPPSPSQFQQQITSNHKLITDVVQMLPESNNKKKKTKKNTTKTTPFSSAYTLHVPSHASHIPNPLVLASIETSASPEHVV